MSLTIEHKGFLRQVQRTLQYHSLLDPNSRVLIACSGGVDSLALVHALLALREHMKKSWTLAIATVDHEIRPEGAAELELVRSMADDLGIPFYGAHIDVPAQAQALGLSLETAGRRARYAFLSKIALEEDYDVVATGHHQNDQAETILAHMVRGAGLKGLGGMAYTRPLVGAIKLVRPFLDVTKAQIRAYARDLEYEACEDATNEDSTYQRNYIRHQILPRIEAINPNVLESLSRLGQSARDDEALLEKIARESLEGLATYENGHVLLGRRALRKIPLSIRRRIWTLVLQTLLPSASWEWSHLDQLDHLIQTGEPKSFQAMRVRVEAQCDTIDISVLSSRSLD